MKIVIALFTLIVLIEAKESENECPHTWFPQKLVDKLSRETKIVKEYVREKSRRLNLYINNVKNKLNSYFNFMDSTEEPTGGEEYITEGEENIKEVEENTKEARIKRKFREYIEDAEARDGVVFDSIAPKIQGNPCSDDPAIHMTTPQLIALHGYTSESHTIVTDDGYILTMHRIPYSKQTNNTTPPRKTVLLHHGLLGSSADWIISGPEKGLAYILSNAGYDVWLANVRGNTYSKAHTSINSDTFAFWNFTFHDVSQHDLPALIDYIILIKGWDVKINYIGHSMGTTVLFALLSTKLQYNKVLRAGYALAPVAFMTNVKSPIRLLAKYSDNIAYLMKLLGANEFLPQNAVLRWLSKHACEINHYEEAICENSMFVLCGHDESQFNRTLLPIMLGHVPAGASTKTLIHYAQEIRNAGRFQQFDYGEEGNMRMYGTPIPPQYPVQKITLPIALFSSENDWLASDVDVSNLYARLSNPIEHYIVPLKEFNHIDFLWAIDAPKLVYKRLLQLLEQDIGKHYNVIASNDIN